MTGRRRRRRTAARWPGSASRASRAAPSIGGHVGGVAPTFLSGSTTTEGGTNIGGVYTGTSDAGVGSVSARGPGGGGGTLGGSYGLDGGPTLFGNYSSTPPDAAAAPGNTFLPGLDAERID